MPKFSVTGIFTASKCLGEFEAATEEEAIQMALDSEENSASLCHYCTNQIELDDHCAHQAHANKTED